MIESINNLPKPVQNMFNVVKNSSMKYGETRANQIAWKTVKQKFTKVDELFVAKSDDFKMYETNYMLFKADELSVVKSGDGFTTIDYILSDNNKDTHKQSYSDFALKSMVGDINEFGLVGRIDGLKHELLEKLQKEGKTNAEIEEILQNRETGIKAISAKYEDGKMVAKIQVDNNILDKVLSYKGASIETRVPKSAYRAGVFNQARAVGFVFLDKPANTSTGLVS